MNNRFTLLSEGNAYFNLSLINGGYNGVMASMTTLKQGGVDLQFDDWSGAGVSLDTSEAMKRIIQGNTRYRKIDFDAIPDGEVVWRPDDRCMDPGPARGFLALQKRTINKVSQLLCMAMKKEAKDDPEDETLNISTILFTPSQSGEGDSDNTMMVVNLGQWKALCYLMLQMRRESIKQAQEQHRDIYTLDDGLRNPEGYFLTTLLPENVARIKSVFGI